MGGMRGESSKLMKQEEGLALQEERGSDIISAVTDGALTTDKALQELDRLKNVALATAESIDLIGRQYRLRNWISVAQIIALVILVVAALFIVKSTTSLSQQLLSHFSSGGAEIMPANNGWVPQEDRGSPPHVVGMKERLDGIFEKTLATGILTVASKRIEFGISVEKLQFSLGRVGDAICLWLADGESDTELAYLNEIPCPRWHIQQIIPRESVKILVGYTDQYFYSDAAERNTDGYKYRDAVDDIVTTLNDLPSFRVERVEYWTDY